MARSQARLPTCEGAAPREAAGLGAQHGLSTPQAGTQVASAEQQAELAQLRSDKQALTSKNTMLEVWCTHTQATRLYTLAWRAYTTKIVHA